MELFEAILGLLIVAVVLLQFSRRLHIPYPALLALAGVLFGALPWAPQIIIEPHLALVLFITPALLDSAYDTAPRELRRNWLPLLSLVVGAVLVTTAAVAWLGWAMAGLPIAAAIALGAIVAPPDAAAAAAVLQDFKLPRRTMQVLQGESLLNDAVALLIFSAAVDAIGENPGRSVATSFLVAVPGGVIAGILMGKLAVRLVPLVAGTLSATICEFVATFAVWLIADRLGMSPILAVVAYAMVIATYLPSRTRPRDRVHSYAVWSAVVFVLNVLAFLLMGLQVRVIISRLQGDALLNALEFSFLVLLVAVVARLAWVMFYGLLLRTSRVVMKAHHSPARPPSVAIGLLVSWCGMRGLVTLATAFALPADFPGRDVIVLSAFTVVLGSLIIQGFTIAPLMKLLKIEPDDSLATDIAQARATLIEAGLSAIDTRRGLAADAVRADYEAARLAARELARGATVDAETTEQEQIRLTALRAERAKLEELREADKIGDDVYHRLEEELDWSELSVAPDDESRLLTT